MPVTTQPTSQRSPSDTPGMLVELNKRALHLLFDTQRVILSEMVTAGDEILEDARAEMLLAAEFAAKISEARSVDNIRTVLKECGQHQMDVFSRESQNLLRRNLRVVEATSQLFANARKGRQPQWTTTPTLELGFVTLAEGESKMLDDNSSVRVGGRSADLS
jgi:hypothetical protein